MVQSRISWCRNYTNIVRRFTRLPRCFLQYLDMNTLELDSSPLVLQAQRFNFMAQTEIETTNTVILMYSKELTWCQILINA